MTVDFRYTKALEVIKKLHKEQAQEIKTYKLKLEHLQTLKDAAYKVSALFLHFCPLVTKIIPSISPLLFLFPPNYFSGEIMKYGVFCKF